MFVSLFKVRLAVALVLTLCLGLHWLVLQSVGWLGMFAAFAQTDSLRDALSRTFDGQHPCAVCKFVSQGRRAEQSEPRHTAPTKVDFALPFATVALLHPRSEVPSHDPPTPDSHLREPPPSPPPLDA